MKPDFKSKVKRNLDNASSSGLTITLPSEIVVKEIPAYQIKTDKIEIKQIVDDVTNKTVSVITKQFGTILLWEGTAYDRIGQWTDDDVKSKLISMYIK